MAVSGVVRCQEVKGVHMSWEAIGAIAELLGALGVIASLVYLATQVRASTRQTRHDAARAAQARVSDSLRSISENAQFADAYARAVGGWDRLETEGERMQLSAYFMNSCRAYEEMIGYRAEGLLDEGWWTSTQSMMRALVSSRGFADWWSMRGSWFRSDFQERIGLLLPEQGRDLSEELLRGD